MNDNGRTEVFNGPLEFLPGELDKKYARILDHRILDPGDSIVFMNNLRSELGHGTITSIDETFFCVDPHSDETVRSRYLAHHIIWLVKKVKLEEPTEAGDRVVFSDKGDDYMAIRVISKEKDGEFAWVVLQRETDERDGWTPDQSAWPFIYTWHDLKYNGLRLYKE